MEDWIYYGLSLMEMLSDKIPEGWKLYCDHMTVIYNDHSENAQLWGNSCEKEIGKRAILTATHLGLSDRAMAIKVTGYPTNNTIPHITIAVAPGAKPVESNQIQSCTPLENGTPIHLTAVLKKILRNK